MLDDCFKMNAASAKLSLYMDHSLESYLVVTYVNSYYSWYDECKRQEGGLVELTPILAPEEVSMMSALSEGTARVNKMFTSNGRGSGKFKGWSTNGVDLYNAMLEIIYAQREDVSRAILRNFEAILQRRFDAAKRGI